MLQNSAGMERSSGLQASWLILLSGMTCLSAWLLKVLGHLHLCLRFRTWDTHIFIIQDILEDSPLDDLLFRLSLQQDKYAMLMMDDRKVYVGKIISLGEPSETTGMDQDISIMPLMSGTVTRTPCVSTSRPIMLRLAPTSMCPCVRNKSSRPRNSTSRPIRPGKETEKQQKRSSLANRYGRQVGAQRQSG